MDLEMLGRCLGGLIMLWCAVVMFANGVEVVKGRRRQ
jgi:hypothetical protein